MALSAPPADSTPEMPSAMASAAPTTGSAPPHSCMSTSRCTRSTTPAPVQPLNTLAPSPLHIAIASLRQGNATSRLDVADAGVIAIAIIAVATVVTNTKALHSDRRNQRWTTETCPRECSRSCSCPNRAASSSQLASSKPHTHTASTPLSGTTCEPWNSSTLPSPSTESYGGAPQIGGRRVECARCQQQRVTMNSPHLRLLGAGRMQEGSCLQAPCFREVGVIMQQKCGVSPL